LGNKWFQYGNILHPRQNPKNASSPVAIINIPVVIQRARVQLRSEKRRRNADIQNPIFIAKSFGPAFTLCPEILKSFTVPRARHLVGEGCLKNPFNAKSITKKKGRIGLVKK